MKSSELKLTPAELRLVLAYRTMDDRGQYKISRMADFNATNYPRYTAPLLRLIVGGVK